MNDDIGHLEVDSKLATRQVAGEVAWQVSALVPIEDPDLIPNTYVSLTIVFNSLSRRYKGTWHPHDIQA